MHKQLSVAPRLTVKNIPLFVGTYVHPDGKKLTSFIGMGKLRYLSASRSSIAIAPGDRILLMSDGVFGTLSDQQMAEILTKCPDVTQAASLMENQVLAAQARGQDNFTAVILGF